MDTKDMMKGVTVMYKLLAGHGKDVIHGASLKMPTHHDKGHRRVEKYPFMQLSTEFGKKDVSVWEYYFNMLQDTKKTTRLRDDKPGPRINHYLFHFAARQNQRAAVHAMSGDGTELKIFRDLFSIAEEEGTKDSGVLHVEGTEILRSLGLVAEQRYSAQGRGKYSTKGQATWKASSGSSNGEGATAGIFTQLMEGVTSALTPEIKQRLSQIIGALEGSDEVEKLHYALLMLHNEMDAAGQYTHISQVYAVETLAALLDTYATLNFATTLHRSVGDTFGEVETRDDGERVHPYNRVERHIGASTFHELMLADSGQLEEAKRTLLGALTPFLAGTPSDASDYLAAHKEIFTQVRALNGGADVAEMMHLPGAHSILGVDGQTRELRSLQDFVVSNAYLPMHERTANKLDAVSSGTLGGLKNQGSTADPALNFRQGFANQLTEAARTANASEADGAKERYEDVQFILDALNSYCTNLESAEASEGSGRGRRRVQLQLKRADYLAALGDMEGKRARSVERFLDTYKDFSKTAKPSSRAMSRAKVAPAKAAEEAKVAEPTAPDALIDLFESLRTEGRSSRFVKGRGFYPELFKRIQVLLNAPRGIMELGAAAAAGTAASETEATAEHSRERAGLSLAEQRFANLPALLFNPMINRIFAASIPVGRTEKLGAGNITIKRLLGASYFKDDLHDAIDLTHNAEQCFADVLNAVNLQYPLPESTRARLADIAAQEGEDVAKLAAIREALFSVLAIETRMEIRDREDFKKQSSMLGHVYPYVEKHLADLDELPPLWVLDRDSYNFADAHYHNFDAGAFQAGVKRGPVASDLAKQLGGHPLESFLQRGDSSLRQSVFRSILWSNVPGNRGQLANGLRINGGWTVGGHTVPFIKDMYGWDDVEGSGPSRRDYSAENACATLAAIVDTFPVRSTPGVGDDAEPVDNPNFAAEFATAVDQAVRCVNLPSKMQARNALFAPTAADGTGTDLDKSINAERRVLNARLRADNVFTDDGLTAIDFARFDEKLLDGFWRSCNGDLLFRMGSKDYEDGPEVDDDPKDKAVFKKRRAMMNRFVQALTSHGLNDAARYIIETEKAIDGSVANFEAETATLLGEANFKTFIRTALSKETKADGSEDRVAVAEIGLDLKAFVFDGIAGPDTRAASAVAQRLTFPGSELRPYLGGTRPFDQLDDRQVKEDILLAAVFPAFMEEVTAAFQNVDPTHVIIGTDEYGVVNIIDRELREATGSGSDDEVLKRTLSENPVIGRFLPEHVDPLLEIAELTQMGPYYDGPAEGMVKLIGELPVDIRASQVISAGFVSRNPGYAELGFRDLFQKVWVQYQDPAQEAVLESCFSKEDGKLWDEAKKPGVDPERRAYVKKFLRLKLGIQYLLDRLSSVASSGLLSEQERNYVECLTTVFITAQRELGTTLAECIDSETSEFKTDDGFTFDNYVDNQLRALLANTNPDDPSLSGDAHRLFNTCIHSVILSDDLNSVLDIADLNLTGNGSDHVLKGQYPLGPGRTGNIGSGQVVHLRNLALLKANLGALQATARAAGADIDVSACELLKVPFSEIRTFGSYDQAARCVQVGSKLFSGANELGVITAVTTNAPAQAGDPETLTLTVGAVQYRVTKGNPATVAQAANGAAVDNCQIELPILDLFGDGDANASRAYADAEVARLSARYNGGRTQCPTFDISLGDKTPVVDAATTAAEAARLAAEAASTQTER